jgi:hypothetical protein
MIQEYECDRSGRTCQHCGASGFPLHPLFSHASIALLDHHRLLAKVFTRYDRLHYRDYCLLQSLLWLWTINGTGVGSPEQCPS